MANHIVAHAKGFRLRTRKQKVREMSVTREIFTDRALDE